jgi:hypothetical protein
MSNCYISSKFYTLEETIVREFGIHRPQDYKVQMSVRGDWRCSCQGRLAKNWYVHTCKHIDVVKNHKVCGWLKIVGMRRLAHNERYIK